MGVDFYICHKCEETFPDCGEYTRCNDDCHIHWCSNSCASEEGWIEEETDPMNPKPWKRYTPSCNFCRKEVAEDYELLAYALGKIGISRDDLRSEYLARKKSVEDSGKLWINVEDKNPTITNDHERNDNAFLGSWGL